MRGSDEMQWCGAVVERSDYEVMSFIVEEQW